MKLDPPFGGGWKVGGGVEDGPVHSLAQAQGGHFAERMYDCMYDSLLISLCRKKSVMPFIY